MIQEPQHPESDEKEGSTAASDMADVAEVGTDSERESEAEPVAAVDAEPAGGEVTETPEPITEAEAGPEADGEAGDEPVPEVGDTSFSDPDKKWYVIHTYSGYETKVKAALEERLQVSPLRELFGKILVPTEDVVEVRGGRRRMSSRKYYPGYILIQMTMSTDTWYLIKNTPKVTGFLGGTNDPTPLSEDEVQKILGQIRGEQVAKPKVEFEEGQNVRVIDGPFANFSGVVDVINHERGKVRIMVTIFGRPTPVELEFLQVEKL
jgi:transcriptional antiterminator NusG